MLRKRKGQWNRRLQRIRRGFRTEGMNAQAIQTLGSIRELTTPLDQDVQEANVALCDNDIDMTMPWKYHQVE